MNTHRGAPLLALLIGVLALATLASAGGCIGGSADDGETTRRGAPLRRVVAAPAAPRPGRGAVTGREKPAKGRFLIATRQVQGPFFAETVIVLLDHSSEGAAGLIVNRPTRMQLSELLSKPARLTQRRDRVHLGGPVEPHSMVFLIRSDTPPPHSQRVLDDVHVTGSSVALEKVVADDVPASRFHAYVGYAGWAPGQLEAEVARGDWYVSTEKPVVIFDEAPQDLWLRLVRQHEGIQVRATPSHVARLGWLPEGRRGLCSGESSEARHVGGGRDT